MKQHNNTQPTVTEQAIKQRIAKAVDEATEKYEQETRRIMQDATASVAEISSHIESMKEEHMKVRTHLIIGMCFIVLAWMVTIMILV
jgi:vacuolar-type H+-ATPase subunit H